MANALTITLTEFRTLGSTETYVGYVAMDEYNSTFNRVADDWAGFKQQLPTLKSLVDLVLGDEEFSDLNAQFTIVDGSVELADCDDEFNSLKYISVDGANVVYP